MVHTNTYMFMSTRFSSGLWVSRVDLLPPSAAYMRQCTWSSLVQVMACRLFGAKPLPEPILLIVNRTLGNKFQWNLNLNSIISIQNMHSIMSSVKMAAILSGPQCVRATPMIELQISYAAELCILKPMIYCSTTVVVSTQETDTDRCKDAFPKMDCLYIIVIVYTLWFVSPLCTFTVNKLLLLLLVVNKHFDTNFTNVKFV